MGHLKHLYEDNLRYTVTFQMCVCVWIQEEGRRFQSLKYNDDTKGELHSDEVQKKRKPEQTVDKT